MNEAIGFCIVGKPIVTNPTPPALMIYPSNESNWPRTSKSEINSQELRIQEPGPGFPTKSLAVPGQNRDCISANNKKIQFWHCYKGKGWIFSRWGDGGGTEPFDEEHEQEQDRGSEGWKDKGLWAEDYLLWKSAKSAEGVGSIWIEPEGCH